jgi:hypothetical protein
MPFSVGTIVKDRIALERTLRAVFLNEDTKFIHKILANVVQ